MQQIISKIQEVGFVSMYPPWKIALSSRREEIEAKVEDGTTFNQDEDKHVVNGALQLHCCSQNIPEQDLCKLVWFSSFKTKVFTVVCRVITIGEFHQRDSCYPAELAFGIFNYGWRGCCILASSGGVVQL